MCESNYHVFEEEHEFVVFASIGSETSEIDEGGSGRSPGPTFMPDQRPQDKVTISLKPGSAYR